MGGLSMVTKWWEGGWYPRSLQLKLPQNEKNEIRP